MNELVTTPGTDLQDVLYEDYLAQQSVMDELTGESDDGGFGFLPQLSVNYQADWVAQDSDGNDVGDPISLPRGQYTIMAPKDEGSVQVFGKEATFRPYVRANRYQAYDNDDGGYKLNTTIFRSWSEPVLDDLGGEWVANKYKRNAVKTHTEIADIIKCQHVLFGTATVLDAKDMNGNSHEAVNIPCVFIAKGSNYEAINDLFNDMKQKGKFINHVFDLPKTQRHSDDSGKVVWYTVHPKWQDENIPLSEDNFMLLKDMVENLEAQNNMVLSKYKKVHDTQSTEEEKEALRVVSGGDLGNDFDDVIDAEFKEVDDMPNDDPFNEDDFDKDNKTMAG